MKRMFGLLMVMGVLVSVVGCASNVEKGDELAQQGKYEEAIKLYEQVKSEDEEYGKAQEGIANCAPPASVQRRLPRPPARLGI